MLFKRRSRGSEASHISHLSKDSAHRSNAGSIKSTNSSSNSIRQDSVTSNISHGANTTTATTSDHNTPLVPPRNPARQSISRILLAGGPAPNPLQTLATVTLEHLRTSAAYGYPLSSNQRIWRKLMRRPELEAAYAEFLKALWACGELFAGLLTRTVEDGWTRLERVRKVRSRVRELVEAVKLAQVEVVAKPGELLAERERAKTMLRDVLKMEREGLLRDVDVLGDMLARLQELLPLLGRGIEILEDLRDGEAGAKIVEADRRAFKIVIHEAISVWRRSKIELNALKNAMSAPGEGIPTLRRLGEEPTQGTVTPPEIEAEEEEFTQAWKMAELGGTPRNPLDATALLAPGVGLKNRRKSVYPAPGERPFDAILRGWIKWFLEEWVKASKTELYLDSNFGVLMEEALRREDKPRFRSFLRKDSKVSQVSDTSSNGSMSPRLRPLTFVPSFPPTEPLPQSHQKGWRVSVMPSSPSISH